LGLSPTALGLHIPGARPG